MAGQRDLRRGWLSAVAVAAGLLAWPAPSRAGDERVVKHRLAPYHRDQTRFRWMDIADNPYSKGFRRTFRYREGQVVVTYAPEGDALRGRLIARGLKPNFAYQLKLEGRPVRPGIADEPDAANWANQEIGTVGRWWCLEDASNTWVSPYARSTPSYGAGSGVSGGRTDPSYGRMDPSYGRDDPSYGRAEPSYGSGYSYYSSYHDGHTLLGYLIFDFVVTDSEGNARHDFRVDSSFHVLWKTSQTPPGMTDGPPRAFRVRGEGLPAYPGPVKPSRITIYPEHEYGRPEPGQLRLPAGKYRCRLLLTEESFHAYGWGRKENLGGNWAHALSDENLEFTIREGK